MSWPDVALALIAAMPGLLAAYYAYKVSIAIRTRNGSTIGGHVQTIEDTVNSRDTLVLDTAHIVTITPPGPVREGHSP